MSRDIVSVIKKDYITNLAKENRRIDGRRFDELRPISIERGVISTAEGSARVKLGNTDVIVGVKAGIGEPYPDSPDKGVLTTSAELIPMAYADFEAGPPREGAIELSRVVDRGIRESQAISLGKLCIIPEEKVWIIFIDAHVIDYDGNLFDAATLGAISALTNTVLPGNIDSGVEEKNMDVEHYPLACTVVKLGEELVVDPNADEERVCSARLTITTDENGDIRAMQKGNGGQFKLDELKTAVGLAGEVNKRTREGFEFLRPGANTMD